MRKLIALTTAATLTFALSSCAKEEPQASETIVAVTSTILKINVVGCEGCTIRLANSVQGREGSVEAVVKNGYANIEVPTKSTPGLTFAFAHPGGLALNGKTSMAVLAYPDVEVGKSLTSQEAMGKTSGSVCWGGTDQREVALRVLVEVTEDQQLRARFSPTQEVAGPLVELIQGGYGSDETPDCARV